MHSDIRGSYNRPCKWPQTSWNLWSLISPILAFCKYMAYLNVFVQAFPKSYWIIVRHTTDSIESVTTKINHIDMDLSENEWPGLPIVRFVPHKHVETLLGYVSSLDPRAPYGFRHDDAQSPLAHLVAVWRGNGHCTWLPGRNSLISFLSGHRGVSFLLQDVQVMYPIQRAHDANITSLWRQNDVATSFWRHNDVSLRRVPVGMVAYRWLRARLQ